MLHGLRGFLVSENCYVCTLKIIGISLLMMSQRNQTLQLNSPYEKRVFLKGEKK